MCSTWEGLIEDVKTADKINDEGSCLDNTAGSSFSRTFVDYV